MAKLQRSANGPSRLPRADLRAATRGFVDLTRFTNPGKRGSRPHPLPFPRVIHVCQLFFWPARGTRFAHRRNGPAVACTRGILAILLGEQSGGGRFGDRARGRCSAWLGGTTRSLWERHLGGFLPSPSAALINLSSASSMTFSPGGPAHL